MQETDFAGKVFVFTGVLHKLSRKEVATIVEDMGAIFKDNVTKLPRLNDAMINEKYTQQR